MNPTQFPTWITWFPCLKFSLHSPPGVWCQQQIRRRLLLQRPGLYLLERLRPACAEHEGTAPLLLKRESDEGFWVRPAVWRSRFRSASGFIRSAPLFSPPSFFPSSFAPCAAHSCFSGSDSHSRSKDTTYRLRHVVKINSESERLENEPARLGVGRGGGRGGEAREENQRGVFFFCVQGRRKFVAFVIFSLQTECGGLSSVSTAASERLRVGELKNRDETFGSSPGGFGHKQTLKRFAQT